MKLFIFSLFMAFCFNATSQTKEETVNWIVEKLNKYSINTSVLAPNSSDYFFYSNYRIEIKDSILTVMFDFFYSVNELEKKSSERKEEIKISEIKNIECGSRFLTINSYEYNVKNYVNDKLLEKDYSNKILIGFNCASEENLPKRLIAAFANLKKYYPRIRKKEAF